MSEFITIKVVVDDFDGGWTVEVDPEADESVLAQELVNILPIPQGIYVIKNKTGIKLQEETIISVRKASYNDTFVFVKK